MYKIYWYLVMDMKLRIRDLREDRDLAQKTVAADLLCDQSLYSKYERGERPLPLELADRLADYFNTSVDYLLGRTDETAPYPPSRRK
jgi:transcriptional regulator with XRE-family HTH domain